MYRNSRVSAQFSMSLDGFIARDDGGVGPLLDWYEAGSVETNHAGQSGDRPRSARHAPQLSGTVSGPALTSPNRGYPQPGKRRTTAGPRPR
ncbi:hypothetical protein ARTHRO9V_210184 [Arthrobacter sp. 9V]|nr:hypothetical protein ARTHRO9V_210184 [Arthrobacter sp. 9V]